jgi:hypothetical protein
MRTGKVQTGAGAASGEVLRLVAADGEHGEDLERRYAADAWQAAELGVPAARGRGSVSFTRIDPPWLREATKRWARHRLSTGCAFGTIRIDAFAIQHFSSSWPNTTRRCSIPSRSTAGCSNGIWPGWRRCCSRSPPRHRSGHTYAACWRITAATAGSQPSRPRR